MNGEGDKYNFPETMNQQNRYLGLPIDELIVTAPLLVLGVLNKSHFARYPTQVSVTGGHSFHETEY